jgi:hypothetical protein
LTNVLEVQNLPFAAMEVLPQMPLDEPEPILTKPLQSVMVIADEPTAALDVTIQSLSFVRQGSVLIRVHMSGVITRMGVSCRLRQPSNRPLGPFSARMLRILKVSTARWRDAPAAQDSPWLYGT